MNSTCLETVTMKAVRLAVMLKLNVLPVSCLSLLQKGITPNIEFSAPMRWMQSPVRFKVLKTLLTPQVNVFPPLLNWYNDKTNTLGKPIIILLNL